jgi:dTDP-4-amino-4,6-dideoxygalactose transaminase
LAAPASDATRDAAGTSVAAPDLLTAHALPWSARVPAVLGGEPSFLENLYITRPLLPDPALFARHLAAITSSRIFTNNGPLTQQLEAALQDHLGVNLCMVFGNGTLALQIALRALDLSGEVITTPFTFPATVHAIRWSGLTPVFCDVDPDTYALDVQRAAELVSERTSAVLPVHVFGAPCDVSGFDALSAATGVRVLYDAAHAFGVQAHGEPIGHFGDLSVLSFHATKLFHTAEGGAIVARSDAMRDKLASLRNFGILGEESVEGVGLNGKLSEVHAAIGLAVLGGVGAEIDARAARTSRYVSSTKDIPGLKLQRWPAGCKPNFSYMTLEVDEDDFGLTRDQLHFALRAERVMCRKYFYPLCSENTSYRHLASARPEHLPNAHRLAGRILCLPLYGELPVEAVDRVTDLLRMLHRAAPRVRRALGDAA